MLAASVKKMSNDRVGAGGQLSAGHENESTSAFFAQAAVSEPRSTGGLPVSGRAPTGEPPVTTGVFATASLSAPARRGSASFQFPGSPQGASGFGPDVFAVL